MEYTTTETSDVILKEKGTLIWNSILIHFALVIKQWKSNMLFQNNLDWGKNLTVGNV